MIKVTRIDTIMIITAMFIILPQLHIQPENAANLFNGVYSFTDTVIKGLAGLVVMQKLSKTKVLALLSNIGIWGFLTE